MASWRYYHDTRNTKRTDWPLKFIISHKGVPRPILTGYFLKKEEWDEKEEAIVAPFKNKGRANARLARMEAIIRDVVDVIGPVGEFATVDDLLQAIQKRIDKEFKKVAKQERKITFKGNGKACFISYARKIEKSFRKIKGDKTRSGSADTIDTACNLLITYTGRQTLPFREITIQFLSDLEKWYLSQINYRGEKNKVNGLGVSLRAIRQIYNLAVKDKSIGVRKKHYPFGHGNYKIRTEKVMNKSISLQDVSRLMFYPLTEGTRLWMHQQYMIFYFEGWGANFKDIAFLKVSQVLDNRFKYRRQKTSWSENSKPFDIELSDIQKRIVSYFAKGKNPDDLLFPIMDDVIGSEDYDYVHKKYKNRMQNHYRRLKSLMKMAGLPDHAPSGIYVLRHSFFQGALENNVRLEEIQQMAGHASMITTQAYIKGFPSQHINNQANRVRNATSLHNNENSNTHLTVVPDATETSHIDLKTPLKVKVNEALSIDKTIEEFLLEALPETMIEGKVSRIGLIAELLTKTDCTDGQKAAQLVDRFLAA